MKIDIKKNYTIEIVIKKYMILNAIYYAIILGNERKLDTLKQNVNLT